MPVNAWFRGTCSPGLSNGHVMQADALDKRSLATVNAYNPGLSGAWMLQRAMSVRPGEQPNPDFINQVTRMPCHALLSSLTSPRPSSHGSSC